MNIEAFNTDTLRKLVRNLQDENKKLKEKLDEANIPMVKYQVKKLELNEKNIMTLEFYLSDQAELQTDGTMEFQCN